MSHTKAIVDFFTLTTQTPLPSRYFSRNIDGYTVVYHQGVESSPKLVARFKNGIIEIPQSAVANGFGATEWKGIWHEVPEGEFLKDFGRSHTKGFGTVNYSA